MTENEEKAIKAVRRYMWWSAGVGLIPIVCAGMAAVGAVQLKMLVELSKIYGVPFNENRGKAAIASLGGFIVPHAAAFGALSVLVASLPAMAVLSGAYSWAVGQMFILHFESGGTFLNFDPEQVKDHFKAQFASGKRIVQKEKNAEAPA